MTSLFRFQMKPRTSRFILRIAFVLSVLFPVVARAQVAITTTALPAGNTSNIYATTLAATGGTGPYTWQLTGGSLPTGLTLSNSGVISGKATTVTPGAPPVPATFTVQATDSALNTATQTYSITVLAPGSHSLVINQYFTGGNGSTSSPYAYNYVELFNASPSVIDLQNWTVQIASATSAFSQTGIYPLGSLDPYTAGTTGGSDGHGNYPAFQITYSAAFTANNCNPAATSTQLNAAFPALHCWLNPGQFMLVLLGTTSSTGALTTLPQITPDLDLTDGYINGTANSADTGAVLGNVGPVAATSTAPTIWLGHNVTSSNVNTYSAKPNPSDGMIAIVNGVGVGAVCPATTIANPKPSAVFSPLTADFIGFIAQLSAGGEAPPICWEGGNAQGYATHVSSSGKNTNALIRSAGNGKINAAVTGAAAPAGTILPTTGVTLTPCGDTDNNLSDFPPIANGLKGQINWVLHNGQQILTKATTTTLNLPASYTPVACPSLNPVGPTVTAAFSQPIVGQGTGGGSVTETLTVTVTPSNNPTSTLFDVNVDLSGVAGASTTAPLTPSSVGVPDGNGNLNFQEQITIPTATAGTLTFPITVLDDAYRGGINANTATPLNATIMVGSACQVPVATAQTLQLGWNSPDLITLAGQVGQNCNSGDTLTYAIQSQPLNGTLSVVSGNSVTYTPNSGFSGLDSFTFNLTDTSNSASPLTGAVATVNLVVNATGVTPVLTLSCPAVTYDVNPHGCTAALTPFVAGTTTISYNGSATVPKAAGSYPVSASFVSNGPSTQNASATAVLVISQATPTLSVLCPSLSFTGSPQGCTASVADVGTAAPSGTISITYNGSSTLPTNGGTYAVLASFTSSDPNYANATITSSLTINEPSVTITANNQTVTYGGALPTLTYAVSPSIPLQTYPVCTSSATGASSVGIYAGAITCSGAAKVGVLFTYVAGSMTVAPAAATVTPNNLTMVTGAGVPTLTYSTTPSGLTFTTAPKCTTTATSSSPAGTYPISCTGAVASNYNLSYASGTMTVSVAPTNPNSIPTITSMLPMSATAGAAANVILTVTGGSFVSGATVLWNGSTRATTLVSATQLTATILAADLATVGTADVAVFNPAPGGGSSTSLTFSIDSPPQAQGAFTVTMSSSTVMVPHGKSGTTSLTFSNLQQGAAVSTVCYNLPVLAYCNYNADMLTISTGATTPPGSYQVLIVCSTSAALSSSGKSSGATVLCGLLRFPIGLLLLYRGRRFQLYGVSLLSILLLMVVIGCAGNGSNQSPPVVPAQVSTPLTLTIQ
jgi:Bacterial Ig domain/Putative Ig domain/MBG domain (YGX type)/MBG domain